ncbi:CHAT domain-containing protein [Streptomyces sp. NPDC051572]|uniref:CHAT domain-containing protein n=1 Tax=Streptomyces sp. NPDC051572 TaxID=3155802 RepID=UPI00344C5381
MPVDAEPDSASLVTVTVEVALDDPWAASAPIPFEVFDLQHGVIAHGTVVAGTPARVHVQPGIHGVRAQTPSGQTLHGHQREGRDERPGDSFHVLNVADIAPRPWLQASSLLVPSRTTAFGRLDDPAGDGLWWAVWSLRDGRWQATDVPLAQGEQAAEGVRLVFTGLPPTPCVLQCGGPGVPSQMLRLPPEPRVAVDVRATTPEAPRLIASVLTPDADAHALLGYLATGATRQAEQVARVVASATPTWTRAAALGYHLIRTQTPPPDWPPSVLDITAGTPDGAVIAGWNILEQMRAGRIEPSAPDVLARFLDAVPGMPVCTDGVHLLTEGLQLLHGFSSSASAETESAASTALKTVAGYATAADLSAPLLTYRGAHPALPGTVPGATTPREAVRLAGALRELPVRPPRRTVPPPAASPAPVAEAAGGRHGWAALVVYRAMQAQDVAMLEPGAEELRLSLERMPERHGSWRVLLESLVQAELVLGMLGWDRERLLRAIPWMRRGVTLRPYEERVAYLEAVEFLQTVTALMDPDPESRLQAVRTFLAGIGGASASGKATLLRLYPELTPLGTLGDAVLEAADTGTLAGLQRMGEAGEAAWLSDRVSAWPKGYLGENDPRLLTMAVVRTQTRLAEADNYAPEYAALLTQFALSLHARYRSTGDYKDLTEAGRAAFAVWQVDQSGPLWLPAGGLSREPRAGLPRFALIFRDLAEATGAEPYLDAAVAAGQAAVSGMGGERRDWTAAAFGLGAALLTCYDIRGDFEALEEAVSWLDRALEASNRNAERNLCRTWLSSALVAAAAETGRREYLEDAIGVGRSVLDTAPVGNQSHTAAMVTLARALMLSTAHSEEDSLAEEARRMALEATFEAHPPTPAAAARHWSSLSLTLQECAGVTGDTVAVRYAVDAARQCVRATRKYPHSGILSYSGSVNVLAQALRTQYLVAGSHQALEQAIEVRRRALIALPRDHAQFAAQTDGLADLLELHHNVSGERRELLEAVELRRETVALTPAGHRDAAARLSDLARTLCAAAQLREPASGLLAEARTAVEEAVRQRRLDAVTVEGLADVAGALAASLTPQDDLDFVMIALVLYRAVASSSASPVPTRAAAAAAGGRLAAAHGQWAHAVTELSTAIDLLARLAGPDGDWINQDQHFDRFANLATDAAACALAAGDPTTAVTLLERGRGILLGHSMFPPTVWETLYRSDPLLGQMLKDAARRNVSAWAPPPNSGRIDRSRRDVETATAQRLTALDREWNDLLRRVRQVDGLEGVSGLLSDEYLRAAGREGPVVIVNVSQFRCDALLLTSDGLTTVPLPGLTAADAARHAERFATRSVGEEVPDPRLDQDRVQETLEWLWDTVANPVTQALGLVGETCPLPRMWWLPTGAMSFLPLHAAGTDRSSRDEPPESVMDRAICSYIPTLSALHSARLRTQRTPPGPHGTRDLLAVSTPGSTGQGGLPAVVRATQHLASEQLPAAASTTALLDALGTHPMVYFACHAVTHPTRPAESFLLLADGKRLSVGDIADHRGTGRLAVLSVCNTLSATTAPPGEHLPVMSAFQLAGYTQVIGTLWTVSDPVAATIAEELGPELTDTADGHPDRQLARALHEAADDLRRRHPALPGVWAAPAHAGI